MYASQYAVSSRGTDVGLGVCVVVAVGGVPVTVCVGVDDVVGVAVDVSVGRVPVALGVAVPVAVGVPVGVWLNDVIVPATFVCLACSVAFQFCSSCQLMGGTST